jgi:hypothetical protein
VWWGLRGAFPVTGGVMILAAVISSILLPRRPISSPPEHPAEGPDTRA